jgi:hypothetical protein
MRILLIIFTLIGGSAWADTVLRCRKLPAGIYPNSAKSIQTIDLVTYVNHFSLANMMAMKLETDSGELVFGRQSIKVSSTTQIKMIQKLTQSRFRLSWLLIDRTPRLALSTRVFKGVLFISEPTRNDVSEPSDLPNGSVKTLNFECAI